MAVNTESLRHLAKSVLCCALLSACGHWSSTVVGGGSSITHAVRWGSFVVILSAIYYLQFQVCVRFWQKKLQRRERRVRGAYRQTRTTGSIESGNDSSHVRDGMMEDVDLDSLPSPDTSEVWAEGSSVVSNNVYYPELTMSSVWTYVYGWGVLLFVCVYCLAGVDAGSACWWALGMTALSLDELISNGVRKWLICVIALSLCGSIFAVWSGELFDEDGNFVGDVMFAKDDSFPIVDFVLSMALPVSAPFIFFSIRSTVRSVTQDVTRLCEFALPFMTVLAACCLVATSGMCENGSVNGAELSTADSTPGRRGMLDGSLVDANTTGVMVETVAKFAGSYVSNIDGRSIQVNTKTVEYALIFISPLLAFWLIRVLVVAILTRHATEFIAAFVLVTAARFGMTHSMGAWSVAGVSGAGFAFVLLLFDR